MYVAIKGLSDHSVSLALDLLEMDARVLLFDVVHKAARENVMLGHEVLNHPFLKKFELKNQEALFDKLANLGVYKQVHSFRFGKKFLAEEEMQGSRMKDLFRVLSIQERLTPDKMPFDGASEKITEDFMQSLQMEREDFDDCDFVIISDEPAKTISPNFLVNYPTVNSQVLSEEVNIHFDSNENNKTFETSRVAIIGDNEEAMKLILENRDWFFDFNHHMDLITTSVQPFHKLKGHPQYNELMKFFNELETYLNDKFEDYRRYVFERRSENKKVEQKEPVETLSLYLGYSALVLDKLYDRNDFFLTLERPSFRDELAIKTVAADSIYFMEKTTVLQSVDEVRNHNEEGVFIMDEKNAVADEVEKTKNNMLRYFSKND